jgi:hypothetical protein
MTAHGFGANRELRLFLTPAGINCRLMIGDQDLSSFVRSVSITATAGETTVVSLDLIALGGITVEGMVAALGLEIVSEAELRERLMPRRRELDDEDNHVVEEPGA